MINKQERRELIAQFSSKFQEHFYFLESEYGYIRGELKKCDFHYPQDAYVAIPYLGRNVGVQIIWSINNGYMTVIFAELENHKIPVKISFYGDVGYWRAIKLESLIDVICPEKIILPLPQITPKISFAETERRINKSTEMIRTDMGGILEGFAKILKEVGSEILKGDTSMFPDVQAYHKKIWV